MKQVHEAREDEVQIYLVGNKLDLENRYFPIFPFTTTTKREIKNKEGIQKAKELKVRDYFELSAKTGKNIQALFDRVVTMLLNEKDITAEVQDSLSITMEMETPKFEYELTLEQEINYQEKEE